MHFLLSLAWAFALLFVGTSADIIAPGDRRSEERTYHHGLSSFRPVSYSLPIVAPRPCDLAPAATIPVHAPSPVSTIPVHAPSPVPTFPVHAPSPVPTFPVHAAVPAHAPPAFAITQTFDKPYVSYQPQIVQRPTQIISEKIEHRPIVTEFQNVIRRPIIAQTEQIVRKPVFTEYQQSFKLPTYTQHILKKPLYSSVREESVQAPLFLAGERYHVSVPPSGGQVYQLPTQYLQPYSSEVIQVPVVQHQYETQTTLTPVPAAPVSTIPVAPAPINVDHGYSYLTPSTCRAGEKCDIEKSGSTHNISPRFTRNIDDEHYWYTGAENLNAAIGKDMLVVPSSMAGYAAPRPFINRPTPYYSAPMATPFVAQQYFMRPEMYQFWRNQRGSQMSKLATSKSAEDKKDMMVGPSQPIAVPYVAPWPMTYYSGPMLPPLVQTPVVDPSYYPRPYYAYAPPLKKDAKETENESKAKSNKDNELLDDQLATNTKFEDIDQEAAMIAFNRAIADELSPNSYFWDKMFEHYSNIPKKQSILVPPVDTKEEKTKTDTKMASLDTIRNFATNLTSDQRAALLTILAQLNDQKAIKNEQNVGDKSPKNEKNSS